MSEFDLEKMRGAWHRQNQGLDARLKLDAEGVREHLLLGRRTAFKRHLRWLTLEIAFGALTLMALLAFVVRERADVVYLAAAMPILAWVLVAFGTDIRHWRILSALDFSAPIVQVRAALDAVRARRLLVVKWIVLSACLLWLPLLAILAKAALGLDLLRGLHASVVAVNIVFGLLLIPLGEMVFSWFSKRFADAPAFHRLVEDASGTSFSAARASFEFEADFATRLAEDDTQTLLARRLPSQWPAPTWSLFQQVHTALGVNILFFAGLVLAVAGFNVVHGGNAHVLIPGIFLHLFVVIHMVASILHRQRLGDLGATRVEPLAAQVQSLQQVARWRGDLARLSMVFAPLLLLALLQVSANGVYAVDLYQTASQGVVLAALLGALLICGVLYFRWRTDGTSFAQSASNALTFGTLTRTRKLIGLLSGNAT